MKTKKEITKIILKSLLISGAVAIASTSPYFAQKAIPALIKDIKYIIRNKKKKKSVYNIFYRLKNQGFIKVNYDGKQIHISLTEEGRKKAGKYQIDGLEIKKSKKWDKKWHVLIFDIIDKHKLKREALRGKLKELGLYQLQKSVWVCPYDFQREIDILRLFFGLKNSEMKVINAYEIEDDRDLKIFFNIK